MRCCDEDGREIFWHCSSRSQRSGSRDQWLENVGAGKDFLTSPIEWEIKIAAYDVAVEAKSATLCEWRNSWTMLVSP